MSNKDMRDDILNNYKIYRHFGWNSDHAWSEAVKDTKQTLKLLEVFNDPQNYHYWVIR